MGASASQPTEVPTLGETLASPAVDGAQNASPAGFVVPSAPSHTHSHVIAPQEELPSVQGEILKERGKETEREEVGNDEKEQELKLLQQQLKQLQLQLLQQQIAKVERRSVEAQTEPVSVEEIKKSENAGQSGAVKVIAEVPSPEPKGSEKSDDGSSASVPRDDVWTALLAWATPLLPQGFSLSTRETADLVLTISASDAFKGELIKKQIERKWKRKAALEQERALRAQGMKVPLNSSHPESFIGDEHSPIRLSIPFEIAGSLLKMDKALSEMRVVWVPSRVSEDTFFACYFQECVIVLKKRLDDVSRSAKSLNVSQTVAAFEQIAAERSSR